MAKISDLDLFRSQKGKIKEESEYKSKVWSERMGEPVLVCVLPLNPAPRMPSSEETIRGRINAVATLKQYGKLEEPTFAGIDKVLANACSQEFISPTSMKGMPEGIQQLEDYTKAIASILNSISRVSFSRSERDEIMEYCATNKRSKSPMEWERKREELHHNYFKSSGDTVRQPTRHKRIANAPLLKSENEGTGLPSFERHHRQQYFERLARHGETNFTPPQTSASSASQSQSEQEGLTVRQMQQGQQILEQLARHVEQIFPPPQTAASSASQ
jgi:hypothetical protein